MKGHNQFGSAELQFECYVEHLPIGVAIYDKFGIFSYINPACAKMLGYAANEMIGTSGYLYVAPDDRKMVEEKLMERSRGDHDLYRFSLKHKNGRSIEVMMSANPIMEDGEFVGAVCAVIEIDSVRNIQGF